MKKILIRADDLGYSRAVNYGIYDSVHCGIVNNVGVMVNMKSTEMGLELLKNENIDLGMHTNISNGKPILPANKIPSLVDRKGYFKSSHEYRQAYANNEDIVNLDEVTAEIDAQYHRFLELIGHKPDYFEGHAVMSNNFRKGLRIVAQKYNLPFLDFPLQSEVVFKKSTKFMPFMGGYRNGKTDEKYHPLELLNKIITEDIHATVIPMIISHAGYLDEDILMHSSLTIPRVKETAAWTSVDAKRLIEKNRVYLIRYSECK